MIINSCFEVPHADEYSFAWNGLNRFRNERYTTAAIRRYQNVEEKYLKHVSKQARQIRYCIVQAREYFEAAKVVGLPTKPLLLYYGTMSLALAEILIKQSGESSLDRARQIHNHHGLTLKVDGDPSEIDDLNQSAQRLRAVSHIKGANQRYGTFELWHRTSRETPIAGERTTVYESGAEASHYGIVATGDDRRPELVPDTGLSLLDCLKLIPSLRSSLRMNNVLTDLISGNVTCRTEERTGRYTQTTYVHPSRASAMEKTMERFTFSPSMVDLVNVDYSGGGYIVSVETFPDYGYHRSDAPFGFQTGKDEIYFSSTLVSLNEFGLYYFALYILGNYARYYPDLWMKDVDSSSPLSLIASDLLLSTQSRVPILALNELAQVYHI